MVNNRRSVTPSLLSVAALILMCALLLTPWSSTQALASPETPSYDNIGNPPFSPDTPPVPRITRAGEPALDANWPMVSRTTKVVVDALSGKHIFIDTVREAPKLKLPGKAAPLTQTGCSYNATMTMTSQQIVGGVTQNLKNYFTRYTLNSNPSELMYYTTNTEEWWTRTSTNYSVGSNSTSWDFSAFNCSGYYDPHSSSGGYTPAWDTSSETFHYWYDFMQAWPTLGPITGTWGHMKTSDTNSAYYAGQFLGNLSTAISYPSR